MPPRSASSPRADKRNALYAQISALRGQLPRVMSHSSAEGLQVFEEEDGIAAVEEAAASVEDEVVAQAGRETVLAFVDDGRGRFGCEC